MVLPKLKLRGLVFKDERTREFVDEDETASLSVGSTSTGMSGLSLGSQVVESIVITDLPDYFLKVDVEDVVRKALKVRQVTGCDVMELGVKRMEWSMGSPMAPTWQVAGQGLACLEGLMTMEWSQHRDGDRHWCGSCLVGC